MIERRAVGTWLPGLLTELRVASHGLRIPAKPRIAATALSGPAAQPVPWTWRDLGIAVLWAAGLAVGGAIGLVILRLLLSVVFFLGEGFGVIPSGTYDRLAAVLGPYQTALTALLLGAILYGAVLFALYRCCVRKHRLSWRALGFQHAGWGTYGRVAALFVPVTLGGVLVTRVERLLLGGAAHSNQAAGLTRGMPALPANFLMLFLLLGIITPIVEETFFRGFLYRLLRNRLPIWAAAAVSAAAFAALHGVPALFPWLFFMGIVFALVVEHTRSLYSSILLHCLTNSLATLSIVVVLSGW